MRISAITGKLPSKVVKNEDILEYIKEYSPNASKLEIGAYLRLTKALLNRTGSRNRYIRDLESGENARELILTAMQQALDDSGLGKDDIDLVIYCGVGKGFLEPANAYFYAHYMGMNASCFDIVDACMSWIRALEIAYQFTRSGQYRHIMIINGEFNAYDHGFPELFEIKHVRQIEYTFPTYTIGEAATATILSPSDEEWEFNYKSVPELCDLCTIPLDGYADYVNGSKRIGLNGTMKFVSYGADLFNNADKYLVELARNTIPDFDEPDIYFPHAASSERYLTAAKNMIKEEKMYTRVFPECGNIVSASIPMGMAMAIEEGRLNRGDKVVFCPASAGMVFGIVKFTF
jgi:acyl-CoA:acyl-CoA alkyltransferase